MRQLLFGLSLFLVISVSVILFLSWKAGHVMPKRKEIRHEVTNQIKS